MLGVICENSRCKSYIIALKVGCHSVAALVIVKQVMSSSKADPWAGRNQAGPAGRDAGERAVHSPGSLKVRP